VCLSASLQPSLLSRDIAQILWNPKYTMPVNALLLDELRIPIGLLVPPCEPHFYFTGDASQLAGGVYSHELHLWFEVL
jgi:hypothetical protein